MNARSPLGRIVRSETVGLYRQADAVLAAAHADAALIVQRATEATERQRATRLADADREACAEAAQMLTETAARTQRVIAGLAGEIAGAIADATAKIIGELALDQAVAAAAQRAIADLVDRNALTVRVAGAQADRVRTLLAAWGHAASVIGDPALAEDACIVETRAGFVRAGLSEQLALLRQALHTDLQSIAPSYLHA